jgi:hypothetical protein
MNVCDLRTLEWKPITVEGDAPTPQYGQAVVMDSANKSFYVSMDVHKLDLSSFVWETLFISRGDLEEPPAR